MTKQPSVSRVPLDILEANYGASNFRAALARFIVSTNAPDLTRNQLENEIHNIDLPWRLPVWHRIKFVHEDPFNGLSSTIDSIHIQPAREDTHQRPIPA